MKGSITRSTVKSIVFFMFFVMLTVCQQCNADDGVTENTNEQVFFYDAKFPSLVSFDAETARSKIFMTNTMEQPVSYNVTYNDYDIKFNSESSCNRPVLSDNICSFDIESHGKKVGPRDIRIETYYFEISEGGDISKNSVQKVAVGAEVFFDPSMNRYVAYTSNSTGLQQEPEVIGGESFFIRGMRGKYIFPSSKCSLTHADQNDIQVNYLTRGDKEYKSIDRKTWYALNGRLPNETVNTLYSLNDILYAGTNSGVYKSVNKGLSWIEMGLTGRRILSLYSKNGDLYAGTDKQGVFKYLSNSINWDMVGGIESNIDEGEVIALTSGGDYLFAAVKFLKTDNELSDHSGVYRINLKTGSWEMVKGIDNITALYSIKGCIYAGDSQDGVFKSCDYGKTWVDLNVHEDLRVSCLHSMKDQLYVGTKNGKIFKFNKEGAWEKITPAGAKMFTSEVTALYSINNCLYVGIKGDKEENRVFKTCNDGKIWREINIYGVAKLNDGSYERQNITPSILSMYGAGKYLYIGTKDYGVFKMLPRTESSINWPLVGGSTVLAGGIAIGSGLYYGLCGNSTYTKCCPNKEPYNKNESVGSSVETSSKLPSNDALKIGDSSSGLDVVDSTSVEGYNAGIEKNISVLSGLESQQDLFFHKIKLDNALQYTNALVEASSI